MRRLNDLARSNPLFGPVLAFVAVVIALGGTSYAATKLGKNSVGAVQLKPNSVGKPQLKPAAVRPETLAFSLGAAGIHATDLGLVVSTGFCVPPVDGGPMPPCAPPHPVEALSKTIKLNRSGFVRVGGTVGLEAIGHSHYPDIAGSALARVTVEIDDEIVGPQGSSILRRGDQEVVPFETFARLPAGRHEITLVLDGEGFDYVNVQASFATMTIAAAPGLPTP